MTGTISKTKAEQGIAAEFRRRVGDLPGGAAARKVRSEAMDAFERAGLPHRRIEAWKYTDLRAALKEFAPVADGEAESVSAGELDDALGVLASIGGDRMVFVDGRYDAGLSTKKPQVSLFTLGEVLKVDTAFPALSVDEPMVALNGALATDGAIIGIPDHTVLEKPIVVIAVASGPRAKLVSLRHAIKIGAKASATIIEVHLTLGIAEAAQSNSVVEISTGAHSELRHVVVGLEGAAATHIETLAATLGADASFRSFQFTAGTGLARNQTFARFAGEGARLDISGLMLGRGREHIDTTLVIDHAVPSCESRELFKAVLDDAARAVFQGKVIVRPDAQKTDGKQMAKALMLSEACEFDAKPELEIYADDVVCGHGATVAEIDPDMMFYLRSRGIPPDEARAMLIDSFAGDVLEKIEDERLRGALSEIARDWLERKMGAA